MNFVRFIVGWVLALFVLLLRMTCRIHLHDDPRPALRLSKKPYAYAILHCHQLSAVLVAEAGTAAMVSRSVDGDFLVPSLKIRHVVAVRGSTRHQGRDKGGSEALDQLIAHMKKGKPAYLAVDGPRGPRGTVHRGIAKIAENTNAEVIVAIPVPQRRYIFTRAWDRFQIPKPFTRIDVFFAEPLHLDLNENKDDFCLRIEKRLAMLENEHDPIEAAAFQRKKIETKRLSGKVEPG
jgi:lysophospholipid acyltransferase (LPLAT)-like uncharacterized protein